MIVALLIIAVALVAYVNGANDNFKGVASLYGSGTASYKLAMRWSALTTAAGAVASVFGTARLMQMFSGKGLVPDALTAEPLFLLSVAVGTMLTGGMATRLGFPVSTTHALTGALVGAGLCADASKVVWSKLGSAYALPLILGPVLAVIVGVVLYRVMRPLGLVPDHRTRLLDALHYLSAGAVCFARGMNDTPKMVALLGGMAAMSGATSFGLITLAMIAGGVISARRVAETLAHKITDMNPGQGLVANITTAGLVILGSVQGLPLSTTHVTVGSLLGIGITTNQAKWRTIVPVLLAWVITLPCAALLAAITFALGRLIMPIR